MQNETPAELTEAEELMHEVRRLLVHSENALDEEGVRKHAETLEHWLESYRHGLSAAYKLSKNSEAFLQDMRDRLKMSLEEIQRLEDEGGGTSTTKEQRQRMEDLSHAIRRIDHLICRLGETFKMDETEEA